MRPAIIGVLAFAVLDGIARRADPDGEDPRHLRHRRRGRQRHALRVAVRRVGAHRHRNGGAAAVRDADRIMAAVKDAGLTQIDHLITTHWHGDHFGGMAELAARIPIRQFIDHGPNVQPAPPPTSSCRTSIRRFTQGDAHGRETGDRIPHRVSTGASSPRPERRSRRRCPAPDRPNPYCAGFKPQEADPTENAQSVGSFITFGKFRVAHLGDLTWNKEFDLMCPTNRIGAVDLFVVSHHGQAISNSEALVHALHPRVAIMNNGTRKGGQPAMKILHHRRGSKISGRRTSRR